MSGVDLAPLVELLLIGLALGALPLAAWIWRAKTSEPRARLRALTVLTLFLTFDLVVFGAFTRLTDSGLGCPDWPGCYGEASPLGARAEIAAEQAARPSGPVTHGKAWVEMVHRYWASAVGFLILVLAALAYRWRSGSLPHPAWSLITLAWVLVQGAFGALTVTLKLYPAIVTLHLLFGLGLLVLLALQAERLQPKPMALPLWGIWMAAGALLWLQIALGGWVSTNYAVLICRDFPTCQGQWWPSTDFEDGFRLMRQLGQDGEGGWLSVPALTAIHLTHRIGALFATGALLLLAWALHRSGQSRWAGLFAGLLVWQLVSGISNVILGWPLVAALMHSAGAAALVIAWSVLGARLHAARRKQPQWREAYA
jgi:heme a synthase